MVGHRTPEDAVRAEESVPSQYARIIAVAYAPGETNAVVFIAYNEPPDVEPYVVLCENAADGWSTRDARSGGDGWMSTANDGSVGVRTTWDPPHAQWDATPPEYPRPDFTSSDW